MDFLFLSGIDVTMRKIFKRGALSGEETVLVSKEIGYADSLDKVLTRPEILFWKEEAKKRLEVIWPIVYEHARPQLSSVLGYLRQEGMMEEGKIGIVDSGWVGTTQRSLKRLISVEKPDVELEGYYFGLYELPNNVDKNTYHSFYFRPWKDIEKKVLFSNCLFEAVFSEASGMTLSYEKVDDRYEPKVEAGEGMNSEFLQDMTKVVIDYAKALKDNSSHDNGVRVSEKILKRLMAYPDEWEAGNYGRLKFCDDVLEYEAQDIAAELSYEDIKNLRFFRKLFIWTGKKLRIKSRAIENAMIHESGWLYASIVRCGINIDWSLFCARMYQRIMYARKAIGIFKV